MRRLTVLATLCVLFVTVRTARAQQFDAAFGFGSLTAPGPSSAGAPSIRGGMYPSFSADFLFHRQFGIQGEVSWRARQNLYLGYQPYRPIFYDFNGIWAPKLGKKTGAELMAGIGGEDLRFYTGQYTCNFVSCTNYVSSNHFMGHVGGGLRYYVWGHAFVRPEAHAYFVHNNQEFSSGRSYRFAVSIGYSFTPGF